MILCFMCGIVQLNKIEKQKSAICESSHFSHL